MVSAPRGIGVALILVLLGGCAPTPQDTRQPTTAEELQQIVDSVLSQSPVGTSALVTGRCIVRHRLGVACSVGVTERQCDDARDAVVGGTCEFTPGNLSCTDL